MRMPRHARGIFPKSLHRNLTGFPFGRRTNHGPADIVAGDPLRSRVVHRRFGHVNPQLPEFPENSRGTPGRVRLPHLANQSTHLLGKSRTAKLPLLAQTPPVVPKTLPLPGEHGPRLDKRQSLLPARPYTREPRPQQAIGASKPRAMNGLFIHG